MRENNEIGFFGGVIRGALVTVITALIGVLVFAFIVKTAYLNDSVMRVVNQFIKVLSIFLGCMFSPYKRLGIIKGVTIGVFGSLTIHLLFSLLLGQTISAVSFVVDLIFALVVGAISGVISVNLRGE